MTLDSQDQSFESNLISTFEGICKHACEMLKVDHSGFVRFDKLHQVGQVVAEYPPSGLIGKEVKLRGIAAEEDLLRRDEPLVIPDVRGAVNLGEVKQLLLDFDIESVCIVQVRFHNFIIGSFSLDSRFNPRAFTPGEIQQCRSLADLASKTIEHAQLLDWLEAFQKASAAITAERELDSLFQAIVKQADMLFGPSSKLWFGGRSVGLYWRMPATATSEETLKLVASSDEDLKNRVLTKGEGMAWRLLETGEPYLAVPAYDDYSHRAREYEGRFGSVLEVPMIHNGEAIGVIYLSDDKGRIFADFDAELLARFARMTVPAIQHCILVNRLKQLSDNSSDVSRDLDSQTLDVRLDAIARYATEVLNAEMCGVFQLISDTEMELKASHGHAEGTFARNKRFLIRDDPATGLTGAIAARLIERHRKGERSVINLAAKKLANDPAVAGNADHVLSGKSVSILAVPLVKKSGVDAAISGMLRITNKRAASGRPDGRIEFNDEDEWVLRMFADASSVAIETGKLVDELRQRDKQRSHLLSTWNTLTSKASLEERLNQIAADLVAILDKSYCRILLADDSGEYLTLKAAALHPALKKNHTWNTEKKRTSSIIEWPRLKQALATSIPYGVTDTTDYDGTLKRLSSLLSIQKIGASDLPIRSLYSVPMVVGSQALGLLSLGELRDPQRTSFEAEERTLAAAVAAQATVMIDRELQESRTRHREAVLSRLEDVDNLIKQQEKNETRLYKITECAKAVFECSIAGIVRQTAWQGPVDVFTSMGDQLTISDVDADFSGIQDLIARSSIRERTSLSDDFRRIAAEDPVLTQLGLKRPIAVRCEFTHRARSLIFIADTENAENLVGGDLALLETFANHCAVALADAAERENTARERAELREVVADSAAGALENVVRGIKNTMNADAVTLYRLAGEDHVVGDPITIGLQDVETTNRNARASSRSVVGRMIGLNRRHVADDARRDPFMNGAFVERERIVSSMAMPIWPLSERRSNEPAPHPIGVLFVNYRHRHHFSGDDRRLMEMFAQLANVAIRNQELLEREMRDANGRVALDIAAFALRAAAGSEQETLQLIAKEARRIAAACVEDVTCVGVGLQSEGTWRAVASGVAGGMDVIRRFIGTAVRDERSGGRIGVMGRAVHTGSTQLVNNVSEEKDLDYIAIDPRVRSQLAIPITDANDSRGAISIESAHPWAFDETGKKTFEHFASLASETLRRAQQREDALATAHKFGTPLSAIETFLLFLEDRVTVGDKEEALVAVQSIRATLETAKRMVHHFKSLTKAESIKALPIPLKPILEKSCGRLKSAGVSCDIKCEDECMVVGDHDTLEECFDELVSNSMRWFNKAERRVRVDVVQAEPATLPTGLDAGCTFIRIRFGDNGEGVAREQKQKIFDWKVHGVGGGDGIGLSIVQHAVRQHRGTIAEVGVEGEGADFVIYLPQAPPAPGNAS